MRLSFEDAVPLIFNVFFGFFLLLEEGMFLKQRALGAWAFGHIAWLVLCVD